MALFSERYGYKKVRDIIQKESIDETLKTSLWNILYFNIFEHPSYTFIDGRIDLFCITLWSDFLNIRRNAFDLNYFSTYLETWFLRDSLWNEKYDLIEFIVKYLKSEGYNSEGFIAEVNIVLEKNLAAYRIVSTEIVEITSEEEINEIEKAVNTEVDEINEHIQRALIHLANGENPDYRNSIKESISAVECCAVKITDKNTLGDALREIRNKNIIDFTEPFNVGLEKIYGWTNGPDGIRHALMDKTNLDLEDARFMLVMSSSFVNYLIEKINKAGIEL